MTTTAFIGAFALTAVLSGCATSADEPNETSPEQGQAEDEVTAQYNDADVEYISGMIPHHRQAVHMSEMLLNKDDVAPEVEALAEDISDAQGPEIEQMESWLDAWGQEEAGADRRNMGDMDHGQMGEGEMDHEGMMSGADLDQLEESTGSAASRMFLEHMIVHHEGAISSAERHLQEGQNPEALELSENIIEDQQTEIDQMEELLTDL